MEHRATVLGVMLAVVAGTANCGGCASAGSATSDAAPASIGPSASAKASSSSTALAASKDSGAAVAPCRVMSASGDVLREESHARLIAPAALVDAPWISLGKAAKISVTNAASAREIGFEGPGRVRPCVGEGLAEEAWLTTGTFASSRGTGARPGAEEWVITPFVVVRYASQAVEVSVSDAGVDVTSAEGVSAFAGGAVDAGDPAWAFVHGKATFKPGATMQSLVDRCVQSSQAASDLAASIAAPDAALGELAPRHVAARQLARAYCAMARVRLELLPPAREPSAQRLAVDMADARWRRL